jgi:hypothetical protein
MKICNLKYTNFTLVRKITYGLIKGFQCPAKWYKALDNLKGTQPAYGIYGKDCDWNIEYD